MKSYTVKTACKTTKEYRSPIELSYLKEHIDELAAARDDGKAVIEQDDIIHTALLALRAFHHCEDIASVEIITCECYCDMDNHIPMFMADALVYYWLHGKYHISKLSALSIERDWSGMNVTAFIRDFVETEWHCI